MKKYIAVVFLFLSACHINTNRDSDFVITQKEQIEGGYKQDLTNAFYGNYKYHIEVTKSDDSFDMYSDSDWAVGTALHLMPKK